MNEPEKATYSFYKKQNIVRLVNLWVELYGQLLEAEPYAKSFLEVRNFGMVHFCLWPLSMTMAEHICRGLFVEDYF